MTKYPAFKYAKPEELVFSKGDYNVYRVGSLGRYYLIKKGKEVAFKNVGPIGSHPDFIKWIGQWEQNCRKQIDKLEGRIEDLKNEQTEIINLLED